MEPLTPVRILNAPGLSALAVRVGTHARFKSSMQAALIKPARLRELTTRESDDFTIVLLDGWAAVLDVLTFYQERIANEGYLRTATERRSVLEMARSIGYELGPGVAAGTFLALILDEAPGAPDQAIQRTTVPVGTKVQSVPGPDEKPQTFETVEPLDARLAWNELKVRQSEISLPYHGQTILYLKGTTTNLKPGDGLLIVGDERVKDPSNDNWDFRRVKALQMIQPKVLSLDPRAGTTEVTLDRPLGSWAPYKEPAKLRPKVFALRQRANLFGYNAPDWRAMSEEIKGRYYKGQDPVTQWPNFGIASIAFPSNPSVLTGNGHGLHGEYFDNKNFTNLKVTRIDPTINFTWAGGSPSTDISIDTFSVRWKGQVWPRYSEAYTFYTYSDDGVRLTVNGKLIVNNWTDHPPREDSGTIMLKANQPYDIELEYYENRGDATIKLSWSSSTQSKEIIPADRLTPPPHVHLDATYPQILPKSWLVLSGPTHDGTLYQELYEVERADEDARSNFTLSTKTTHLVLKGENLPKFERAVRETMVFAQSEELLFAERPWVRRLPDMPTESVKVDDGALPPVEGDRIEFATNLRGLEKGRSLIVSGKRTRVKVADDATTLQFVLDDGASSQPLVPGERLLVLEVPERLPLQQGMRWHLKRQSGLTGIVRAGSKKFLLVRSEKEDETVSEVVWVKDVTNHESLLVLDGNLEHSYDRQTVKIYGNVARATHGESRRELLGSGEAAKPFQKFILKQQPLTYVSSATPSGSSSTLEIRVNNVLWKEVESLFGVRPDEQVYVTRHGDDGSVSVEFGDSVHGSRLPTGTANVTARYRVGTGLAGLVKPKQLSLLLTRPLGVRDVINPLASSGAGEPERLEDARRNAPLTVLTLDRIVSLQDVEDFARAFPGIGKAQATPLWSGEVRVVHLTVSGAGGATIEHFSDLYRNLVAAINGARHADQVILVQPYRSVQFKVSAAVLVDPRYITDQVLEAAAEVLEKAFSFEQRSFGQGVDASEIVAVLQGVSGVFAVDVNALYRTGTSGLNVRLNADIATKVAMQFKPAELLTIDPNIELSVMTP